MNYWHQIDTIVGTKSVTVLEVGGGNRLVADHLVKLGFDVTVVDIDPELKPDIVGSVLELPFQDNAFDVILAAEVLEHLPFCDFSRAVSEIRRVTKKYAVISIPHSGAVFYLSFKLPLLKRKTIFLKIPYFWVTHKFNREHYWEIGKKGYPVRLIIQKIREAGFTVLHSRIYGDDPARYHFLLKKVTQKI